MPELVFIGNVYAFILTIILFISVAVTCHIYIIKVKKSKRFDKLSFIVNIVLSIILSIIFIINFEFTNNEVIENQNILQDTQAVAINKAQLPEDLRITESNKRLSNMLDSK